MDNRILICQLIPKDEICNYNMSQSLINFNMGLLSTGLFHEVLSLVPVNIILPLDVISRKDERLNYIQSRFRKRNPIGKLFALLCENLKIVRMAKNCQSVWYSNMNQHTILSCLLLMYIFRCKVYNIMTDYTPVEKFYSIKQLQKYMIEHMSGIIVLSSRSCFRHHNMSTLSGIIPLGNYKTSCANKDVNYGTFLFSGALERITGIDLALKVFSQKKDFKLIITGRGSEENLVRKYANEYSNIVYYGFLEYIEYRNLLEKITFCLSLRNPNYSENKNNFPSKIIEFFSDNKVLISTIEYPELVKFKYFACDYSEMGLSSLLDEIMSLSVVELRLYQMNAETVTEEFSTQSWTKEILYVESRTL